MICQVLGLHHPHVLGRLLRAPSVPKCAYVRGNAELLRFLPSVAIVGTRKPSEQGLKRAFNIAAQLSQSGVLIVSGGAIGIDMAAHRGAISVEAETLAVLGEPARLEGDERPERLRKLGSLLTTVTVFAPETQIGKTLFVARNQYIAALVDAVVIVEGTLNSGTLHTARYAQKIGIPVWAIPGDPDNPLASASNSLLQNQEARALFELSALVNALGLEKKSSSKSDCLEEQHPWQALFQRHQGSLTLDILCDALHLPISQIQSDLLRLELTGRISRKGAEIVWQNHS
ncbi:MAG: DNA-processing protein DprA [Myxococcaceae bacterium]|nr:DNA-processing protein DprA [Myxococcaceae bacterium]MBH2006240.1 DNA-processing protein DprA [Myxococcaceae bacterium]